MHIMHIKHSYHFQSFASVKHTETHLGQTLSYSLICYNSLHMLACGGYKMQRCHRFASTKPLNFRCNKLKIFLVLVAFLFIAVPCDSFGVRIILPGEDGNASQNNRKKNAPTHIHINNHFWFLDFKSFQTCRQKLLFHQNFHFNHQQNIRFNGKNSLASTVNESDCANVSQYFWKKYSPWREDELFDMFYFVSQVYSSFLLAPLFDLSRHVPACACTTIAITFHFFTNISWPSHETFRT